MIMAYQFLMVAEIFEAKLIGSTGYATLFTLKMIVLFLRIAWNLYT